MMNTRLGFITAILAFTYWGFVTVFWKQITAFSSHEVMSYRIIFSFLSLAFYFLFSKKLDEIKEVLKSKKQVLAIFFCAILLLVNWTTFLYAIYNQHIIESSLGYFINPLATVFLGVFVLKETLRRVQWFAIIIAFIGISFLISKGVGAPWISLVLAGTFSLYGLIRKMTAFPTMVGLFGETFFMGIPALGYLIYLGSKGALTFSQVSLPQYTFLSLSGVATLIPLVLFGVAVKNLKLSTVGLIQYLAPSLQLIVGVMIYKESFTQTHLLAFTFIWIALIIYSAEGLFNNRIQEVSLE